MTIIRNGQIVSAKMEGACLSCGLTYTYPKYDDGNCTKCLIKRCKEESDLLATLNIPGIAGNDRSMRNGPRA